MNEFLFPFCVCYSVWFLGILISKIVSHYSKIRPGDFRCLRYNFFIDRYTIGGKIVERGQVFEACIFEEDPCGCSSVAFYDVRLEPTFWHWALYSDKQNVRIKTKIGGLYACFREEVNENA